MKTGSKTMDRADQRQVLEAFSKDFVREMHNLQERPDTIWQQMYNRLQWADGPAKDGAVTKVIAPEFDKRTAPKARPWFHLNSRLRESGALIRILTGHTNWVRSCAFSPDGRRIVSASDDYTLKLWDADGGQLIDTFKANGGVSSCAFSPLNNVVACGDVGGNVYILEPVGFGLRPMKPEKRPLPEPIEFIRREFDVTPFENTETEKKRWWRSRRH